MSVKRLVGRMRWFRRAALRLGYALMTAGVRCVRYGLAAPDWRRMEGELGPSYEDRVTSEIHRFKKVKDVHELPPIFHYWSNRYIRPKLEQVLEVSGPDDFYMKYICRFAEAQPQEIVRIASLGAGNGDTELRLARNLIECGVTNFCFHCLDLNPAMLGRGAEMAKQKGLADRMQFEEADLSKWKPERPFPVVIANHVLHHIVPLEEVFENVRQAIGKDGYFLSCDVIGRNGHLRWPEALALVLDAWRTMPDRYKYNHMLSRHEELYENWDCSSEGFEGIRAQDILPLLVKNFHFDGFVAFGNLPDVFVSRTFGHNFDAANPEDTTFIDRIATLNDRLIDQGSLKPTEMVAAMRREPCASPRFYKHWTPEFCVRQP